MSIPSCGARVTGRRDLSVHSEPPRAPHAAALPVASGVSLATPCAPADRIYGLHAQGHRRTGHCPEDPKAWRA